MNKEIEKKFLVDLDKLNFISFKDRAFSEIIQGYLLDFNFRLRQILTFDSSHILLNIEYFQTIKIDKKENDNSILVRDEFEHLVDKDFFSCFWPLVKENILRKIRYNINFNGKKVSIDFFKNQHEGLVIAEIEFPNIKEAKDFKPFDWMIKDVSNDKKYQNYYLATQKK